MNLAVFLTPGDSLGKQSQSGQDQRFIDYYLRPYSQVFEKVYVLSYADNNFCKKLPANVILLPNKHKIYYLLYQFLAPFLYKEELKSCRVLRVMQATGVLPAVIAKLFFKSKLVVTYGFDYVWFTDPWLKAFLLKIYLSLILPRADKIIVTSRVIQNKLTKNYPNKIVLIPNGVDINRFKKLKVAKTNKQKIVLNIGRLERQKNQWLLIEAVAKLSIKNRLKILIIGRGKLKKELQELAKTRKVNLEIIESIAQGSLPKYYSKAEIFCLPSLYEGQSKVLLEALSCQVLVCASKIQANTEIIKNGNNGLLFNLTVSDLSRVLEKLLTNSDLSRKISANARNLIIKNHNIEKLVKKEIDLLQSV